MAENLNDIKSLTFRILELFSRVDNEDFKWVILKEYKTKFLRNDSFDQDIVTSYVTIMSKLIDSLRPDLFIKKWQESLFDEIFLLGVHHEAFIFLTSRLSEINEYNQKKILNLLVKFLQGSSMKSLLTYQCVSHAEWELKYVSKSNVWDNLITAIISLPEKVANKTKGKCVNIFKPNCYIPLLLSSVFQVLIYIHNCLKNSIDCSLVFLTKLCGRLCVIGNADILAKKFVKEIIDVSEFDFLWRRISQCFISKMPTHSLDYFITYLLIVTPWYGYVEWIMGDEGVKNEKINYLMSVKLIFLRTYKPYSILQNIIGYFASSPLRQSYFCKILNSLLDSWRDERALRCQNVQQKMYIASALIICAGWIRQIKCKLDIKECIIKVIEGTQLRLQSSEDVIRSLGMIVGQSLTKSLEPNSSSLEFEISDIDLYNELTSLIKIPEKPSDNLYFEDLKCFEEYEAKMKQEENISISNQTSHISPENDDIDSDDDLEPYEMSHDMPLASIKYPLYLRDCMKGLIEQEDSQFMEQCLKHAEVLIKNNPYALNEVAEEMAKIVLHLDDKFALPNFLELRHRILITLLVESPHVVSKYLTSQFFSRDYNIRQRLDILEVLAASSMLLSCPNAPIRHLQPHSTVKDFVAENEIDWKAIVKYRIEAKTKYFTKTPKSVSYENKFSVLAEQFFFPLLDGYSKSDVLKRESYVLGRYIYTLGMIMNAATNTLHSGRIGKALLQFLNNFQSHPDPFVRQSVLFAVASTYTSVNYSVLMSILLPEVTDTNDWLQSVALNDPESSCMEKAIWAQALLRNAVHQSDLMNDQLFLHLGRL